MQSLGHMQSKDKWQSVRLLPVSASKPLACCVASAMYLSCTMLGISPAQCHTAPARWPDWRATHQSSKQSSKAAASANCAKVANLCQNRPRKPGQSMIKHKVMRTGTSLLFLFQDSTITCKKQQVAGRPAMGCWGHQSSVNMARSFGTVSRRTTHQATAGTQPQRAQTPSSEPLNTHSTPACAAKQAMN